VRLVMIFALVAFAQVPVPATAQPYAWTHATAAETLAARFTPPPGFMREPLAATSFGAWLRNLPLKPVGAAVMLFDGSIKPKQDVHAAVIDIDTGTRDLQQCADAIMRLRAEWLYAAGRPGEIAFNYTSGQRVDFARWSKGERPAPDGRTWKATAQADASYASFKRYLVQIFAYAGTASLEKELKPLAAGTAVQVGDVFIKGGFPGHAVLVADVVRAASPNEVRFLLIQSFMPAQDMHVLKQAPDGAVSPWYAASADGSLVTPEWTFPAGSHRRWP
jgi:Domain of unknown function (4846)